MLISSTIIILLSHRYIGTSTRSKNLKQTLLQEIDMAMMDNSSQESFHKNSIVQDLQFSGILFMKNDWDWKVKEII